MAELLERLQRALADRYAVERELGRGGMATVYLAEERHPQRHVAIKVLDPTLGAVLGPERFLREVDLASKLAHPHILPIYAAAEADGLLYYVMPYVEGESLRDRLTREKQLPLDDALQISREVADALSYAHSRGVVHRDIKPENILLESGHAVVADFGIARALSAAGGARLTETGLAVGTPAYMSPEQAAGSKDLDGRSDLYSLGCVLYEMLAGDAPYTASTPQAVIAKKLSEPLPRISVVREALPPEIEAALNKALARTPADRWVTAAQFVAALAHREALATPSGGTRPTQTRRLKVLGRLPRWAKWATGVATVVVVALVAGQLLKRTPLSITVSDITQVTNAPGVEFEPAISPDGQEVAYVAGSIRLTRLFVRSTVNRAGEAAIRLGDTARGSEWLPRWTADGQSVRFIGCPGTASFGAPGCAWRETGKLGGAVQPVTVPRGAMMSWSPDGGRIAFFRGEDSIFTTSATDTVARLAHLVGVHTETNYCKHSLAWSPDGRLLAYVNGNCQWRSGGLGLPSSIWVVSSSGGKPKRITPDQGLNVSPVWLDTRHLLFVSDRDGARGAYVVAAGPDGARGEPRIIPGIADPHSISYSPATRTVAFAKFTYRFNIRAYPLRGLRPVSIGSGARITTGNQVVGEHDVSPNGRWLVFRSNRRGVWNLYELPLAGGDEVELTDLPRDVDTPRWSPDGSEIAFSTNPLGGGGRSSIMVQSTRGGTPVAAWDEPGFSFVPVWSPDGLHIAFITIGPRSGGRWEMWVLSRDSVGGRWRDAVRLVDSSCPYPFDWAPDGSGVLCSGGSGLRSVSLEGRVLWERNLAGTSGLSFLDWGSDPHCRYARDGHAIYCAAIRSDGLRGIWAIPVSGGEPRLAIAADDAALDLSPALAVGRDRLYVSVGEYESNIWVAKLRW